MKCDTFLHILTHFRKTRVWQKKMMKQKNQSLAKHKKREFVHK